jgi:DNA-binding NarL/FixJ family response regulator
MPSDEDILKQLTPRQIDVLACMATGASDREIARRLGISMETVKQHIFALKPCFPVKGRIRVILYALRSPAIVEAMQKARARLNKERAA